MNLPVFDSFNHVGEWKSHFLFHFLEKHRRQSTIEFRRDLKNDLACLFRFFKIYSSVLDI